MKYISTRNNKKTFEFKDVFIKGLADDGGLFIPESLRKYSETEMEIIKSQNQKWSLLKFQIITRSMQLLGFLWRFQFF